MSNYCKYYKQKKQKSIDGGKTWADVYEDGSLVYKQGDIYENCSWDCGYPIGKKWFVISDEYICENFNKYQKEAEYVIYGHGDGYPWYRTIKERIGEIIEEDSASCLKFKGTYPNGRIDRKSCNSSNILSREETTPSWSSGGYTDMETAIIGDCVTSIGDNAFQTCTSLSSITIPNSVTSIGREAFATCNSLTNITIPDSVKSIGESAFASCTNLKNLVIPPMVSFVESGTCRNCSSLTSVTIPNRVITIGAFAFEYCTSLSSVTIPDSVTHVGERSFHDCSGLTSVAIGSGVTYIGEDAFMYCVNLTSITIPSGVTEIIKNTFYGCSNLTSVNIPDSVTYIGRQAFYNCGRLTNISIPSGITTINDYAFEYCGLTAVTYPNATIGERVFASCPNLSSVTFDSGVTSISEGAFSRCGSLTSITIPSGVTSIADRAFERCTGLTSITVNAITPPSIGNYVFDNTNDCPIYVPCESFEAYKNASGWYGYRNRIDCNAEKKFVGVYDDSSRISILCSSATTLTSGETRTSSHSTYDMISAEIGNCVTTIGSWAFDYFISIKTINIPDSVISIGAYAFNTCRSLISVTIPSGVTSIGNDAFRYCTGLTGITINALTPPTIGTNAFTDTNNCPIYVHCDSLRTYRNSWLSYADRIQAIESDCYDPSIGYSIIANYSNGTTYSAECNSEIELTTATTKPSGYTYSAMTSAEIGDCVTSIGDNAFSDCTSLSSVTIPDSVTYIGRQAFYNCDSLKRITIPSGVTTFGYYAFAGCDNLSYLIINATTPPTNAYGVIQGSNKCIIYVPSSSVNAYKSAFGWNDYASRIVACCPPPEGATKFKAVYSGGQTYSAACDSSTELTSTNTKPSGYTYSAMTSAEIGDCIERIDEEAFYRCTSLSDVKIGSGIIAIENFAFGNCTGLISMTIMATTPPTTYQNTFNGSSSFTIYVPASVVETYKSNYYWSAYADRIQAIT